MPRVDVFSLPLAGLILFLFFLSVSFAELILAFLLKEKARKIVKPFCLFLLFLSLVFLSPSTKLIPLYVGLLLDMAGDVLLAVDEKGDKLFVIGAVFFLFGHFAYLAEAIWLYYGLFPIFYLAIWGGLYLVFWLGFFFPVRRVTHSLPLGLSGSFYLATLASLMALGFLFTGAVGVRYGLYLAMGALFFLLSDLMITARNYVKRIKRCEFYIMLTYLLGVGLIASSLLLSFLA